MSLLEKRPSKNLKYGEQAPTKVVLFQAVEVLEDLWMMGSKVMHSEGSKKLKLSNRKTMVSPVINHSAEILKIKQVMENLRTYEIT